MAQAIRIDESLREFTLDEEFAMFGEDDVVEMTNLREQDTGIPGTLFVSTVMGPHGPRVKYFIKTGRDQQSFSVSVTKSPRVLANSLPIRDLNRSAPAVIEWVRMNHDELLRFWKEGRDWDVRELGEWVSGLRRL